MKASRAVQQAVGEGTYDASLHPQKDIVNAHLVQLAAKAKLGGWALVLDTQALKTVRALTTPCEANNQVPPFKDEFLLVPNPDSRECHAMRVRSDACILPVTSHVLLEHLHEEVSCGLRPRLTAADRMQTTLPTTQGHEKWKSLYAAMVHKGFKGFSFVYAACV